jgi:hypothetical protein
VPSDETQTNVVMKAIYAMKADGATAPARTLVRGAAQAKAMWWTLQLGDGVLSDRQTNQILKRGCTRMQQYLTPRRRSRSCPRAVREPVAGVAAIDEERVDRSAVALHTRMTHRLISFRKAITLVPHVGSNASRKSSRTALGAWY